MNTDIIKSKTSRARELFKRTTIEKFAVGAFNIDNQETLLAVVKAAQAAQSPAMVEVSDTEVKALGLDNIRDMVDNYNAEYGTEIYVNLDHSPSVEAAKAGIDAGFEFIHIDVSKDSSYEQIVEQTREVVQYAKTTGALVESEMHYFAGSSNVHTETIDYDEIKKTLTKPDEAKKFVTETDIDTFAVSIGNLHGKYPVPKELDIDLLRLVRDSIDCHISLHGGSDTPEHYFREAIQIGVSKININSDMRYVFRKKLEKVLTDNPKEFAIVKLMPQVIEAVQKVVETKIETFGSKGKANTQHTKGV